MFEYWRMLWEREDKRGFAEKDRPLLVVVSSVFLVAIFSFWCGIGGKYVARDRTLTLENYENHVLIYIDRQPDNPYGLQYSLTVTPKNKISNFKATVEISWGSVVQGNVSDKAVFELEEKTFRKGEEISRSIMKTMQLYEFSIKVIAISGEM